MKWPPPRDSGLEPVYKLKVCTSIDAKTPPHVAPAGTTAGTPRSPGRPVRPPNTMDSSPAELKEHYDTHGYVIVRGLVTPSEHADLLAATERAAARTRSGSWTHARVVGKQFPPYGAGDDVWGVQHVMHPALGEPAFARWYAGGAVRGAAKTLMECQDDHLQMGRLPFGLD